MSYELERAMSLQVSAETQANHYLQRALAAEARLHKADQEKIDLRFRCGSLASRLRKNEILRDELREKYKLAVDDQVKAFAQLDAIYREAREAVESESTKEAWVLLSKLANFPGAR